MFDGLEAFLLKNLSTVKVSLVMQLLETQFLSSSRLSKAL